MQKWMCLGATVVAALTLIVCLADLFAGTPFGGGPFIVADIGGIIASGVVAYMGFNAFRDTK